MTKKAAEMFAIGSHIWNGVSKLSEEAGEVVQVIGKLMGNGGSTDHWDGSNLLVRLQEEIGDVLAACDFVMLANLALDSEFIERRREEKLKLFLKWNIESGGSEIVATGRGAREITLDEVAAAIQKLRDQPLPTFVEK